MASRYRRGDAVTPAPGRGTFTATADRPHANQVVKVLPPCCLSLTEVISGKRVAPIWQN